MFSTTNSDQGQFPPKVPTITDSNHNGAIWESFKIAEYLEKTYPEPSIFGNAKSLHRFFQEYVSKHVSPKVFNLVAQDIVNQILDEPSAEYFRRTREARVGMKLEALAANPEAIRGEIKDALAPIHATIKNSGTFVSGSSSRYLLFFFFP